MTKKEKIYEEKYGHIPRKFMDRILYAMEFLKMSLKDIGSIKCLIKHIISNTEFETLNFIFYFIPEATPRPKYSTRTGTFYVKGSNLDLKMFKEYLKEIGKYEVITTPCIFKCDIFMPIPNDMNKIESFLSELTLIHPITVPDWDNVGKKYSDMIQKELILNDSLIIDGHVRKFYSFKPRVEISIKYFKKYDSKYNKRKVESWKSYNDMSIEKRESII